MFRSYQKTIKNIKKTFKIVLFWDTNNILEI